MVSWHLLNVVIGLAAGVVLGYSMKLLNFLKVSPKTLDNIKFTTMVAVAVGVPIARNYSELGD